MSIQQDSLLQYDVRHANAKDAKDIHQLEKFSYKHPYSVNKIKGQLTSFGDMNGIVLERKGDLFIVGYALYCFTSYHCQVLRMGVLPDMRRIGLATYMVKEMIEKYSMPKQSVVFISDKDNYNVALMFSRLTIYGKMFEEYRPDCNCCNDYKQYIYDR